MGNEHYEVMLAGIGGQGLVVSGLLLANAAMLEEKNVVQTASYGIATRGGFSTAEVIVDSEEILFQQVQQPDVVLVLAQAAMEKVRPALQPATRLFYDTALVTPGPATSQKRDDLYGYPFTEKARTLGKAGIANIIALGAIAAVTGIVGKASLLRVIEERYRGGMRDLNVNALEEGVRLAG